MIVSELSHRTGIPPHVVRYYARIGLLKPNRHPENGYKLFSHDDVHRIRFIRKAKNLGFKLNEIEELLHQAYKGVSICNDVRTILNQRIEQSKAELVKLGKQLELMEDELSLWDNIPNGKPDRRILCPLIER